MYISYCVLFPDIDMLQYMVKVSLRQRNCRVHAVAARMHSLARRYWQNELTFRCRSTNGESITGWRKSIRTCTGQVCNIFIACNDSLEQYITLLLRIGAIAICLTCFTLLSHYTTLPGVALQHRSGCYYTEPPEMDLRRGISMLLVMRKELLSLSSR